MTDITLMDDRVLIHGDQEPPREFPLAYQIHSRLIQTGELARLLAEHLREEGGEELPFSGAPVRLVLPAAWGVVRLVLPISGLAQLQQPMHHLAWALDLHAPEQAEQYLFDYQEISAGDGGASELHLMAMRQNLVAFCRTFCEALGWRLVALRVQGEERQEVQLDLARAAAHREALGAERFPPVRLWRKAVLGAALLVLGATALWFGLQGRKEPAVAIAPRAASPQPLKVAVPAPDSVAAKALAGASAKADTAWLALIEPLANQEDLLPDFFVMDAAGVLVRQEEGGRARLSRVIPRAGKVSRVSPGFYFYAFTTPLPGALLEEDPALPLRRITLDKLGKLPQHLGQHPARVLVQRRRALSGSLWNFATPSRADSSVGWLVTVVPGQARRAQAGRP